MAAGRPHRDRAARRHHAVGERPDDPRRFRQRCRHADDRLHVRDDDHFGAVRRGGLHRLLRRSITGRPRGPAALLALTVAVSGALSAVLATDILIIAIAPLLIAGAQDRGYDPR